MLFNRHRSPAQRPGVILALMVIMLVALMGMLALVIDTGMAMSVHRQTQNAADGASSLAALYLFQGYSAANARTAATALVRDRFGISEAPTINIPPTSGPHAGDAHYAEAIVGRPYATYIAQVVGANSSPHISARAVAGYEPITESEGAVVLSPSTVPGIGMSGGANLLVNGSVTVNSMGAGVDQYGQSVNWGLPNYALSASSNTSVKAKLILVRGGVDNISHYQNYDTGGPNPVYARAHCRRTPCAPSPRPPKPRFPVSQIGLARLR